jgi:hypothetical protein
VFVFANRVLGSILHSITRIAMRARLRRRATFGRSLSQAFSEFIPGKACPRHSDGAKTMLGLHEGQFNGGIPA